MARATIHGTRDIKAGTIAKTSVDTTIITNDGTRPFVAAQSMGGFKLTNLSAPGANTDAATKFYVDTAVLEGGDVPTPVFPIIDLKSTTNLVAGGSVHLDSVVVDNNAVGKVQQITLSSSASCKWEIKSRTAGVDTALDTVFTSGITGNSPTYEWEPPHREYAILTGNGTTTFFRVTVTNLDARNPANAYVTFFFDEVAP